MKKWSILLILILVIGAVPLLAQEGEEEAAPEPAWTGSLGLAWVATTGNTDTSSLGLDFKLDRKPEPWGFNFVAAGNRADNDGETTAENYLVSGRGTRKLTDRWEGFGGLAWSRDPFSGFDSQTVASVGATYIAIDGERNQLSFDGGLAYTWENRVPPAEDVDYFGGLLGLSWELKIGEHSKLTERFVYFPNFDDGSDWRIDSATALESSINSWLALKLGFILRYRHQPIDDAKSTDTTSTASVVFKF
jgi:putative salt-induced outer membrane protein